MPTYSDLTAVHLTALERGVQYTLTIRSGDYTPDNYAAWIDMDQDAVFELGEKLGEFTNTAAGSTGSFTFTVPADAPLGGTVLRVRGVFHNTGEPTPTDPCFNYAYGETEDYGVFIEGSTAVAEGTFPGLSLFPNPASGTTVLLNPGGDLLDLELLDLRGRVVRRLQGQGERITLAVDDLAAGQYVLRAEGRTGVSNLRLQVLGTR